MNMYTLTMYNIHGPFGDIMWSATSLMQLRKF
jgi:hypothetical protein